MDIEAVCGKSVPFFKMQGCGNDFVCVDNRVLGIDPAAMPDLVMPVCRKAFGVGADGMIFFDHAPEGSGLAYIWHFFNADGSRAEMCGNGSRCAARLAWMLGIAPAKHVFGTDAGPIEAEVDPDSNQVTVQLTPPKDLRMAIDIEVEGRPFHLHFVNTGVPHAVAVMDHLELVDVWKLGRAIRQHQYFAPAGTNVNFISSEEKGTLSLRTYERGVEDETYACGTGAVASAIVARELGMTGEETDITTTGGEVLGVILRDGKTYLRGAAELVFKGEFYPQSLGIDTE
ncbi:diaminopimelate epimerase [Solidesulfovibrio magneticus]|uniref:Diaminopimelate epimerase n=1 Tax=Solidesulfovibrio magneticus (strain ATCC 700980 / DSM 13731 / RS-1) TaxID=573370 RepID=C4XHA3_SOLM1|nr:diaminopimelate epimerase [Solidesulfovibrio magneticus]BAH73871.1 diaminopimelate epimerase [Solidesulfovibrio magneticus RS-1]